MRKCSRRSIGFCVQWRRHCRARVVKYPDHQIARGLVGFSERCNADARQFKRGFCCTTPKIRCYRPAAEALRSSHCVPNASQRHLPLNIVSRRAVDKPWLNNYPSGVPATIRYDQYSSSMQLLEGFQKYANTPALTAWAKPHLHADVDEASRSLGAYLKRGLAAG